MTATGIQLLNFISAFESLQPGDLSDKQLLVLDSLLTDGQKECREEVERRNLKLES